MQTIGRTKLPEFVVLICFVWLLAPPASAEVLDDIAQCNSCHGDDGVSTMSNIPTIAGISPFVIEEYMFEYRDDARPCKGSIMCTIAKGLSEDEISEIAGFYSRMKFVAATQKFDATKAAEGAKIHRRYCEKCHTDGGSYADDDASILAGQWMPYLEQVFADYAARERGMLDDKMKEKIDALDAESITALIHFYASMQ